MPETAEVAKVDSETQVLDTLREKFAGRLGSAQEFDAICEITRAILAERKPKASAPDPKPVSASRGARPKMRGAKRHAKARR